MVDEIENEPLHRSAMARCGIVALNLIYPGIGFLRLGNWRKALAAAAVAFLALLLLLGFYRFGPDLSYRSFLILFTITTMLMLVALIWSMVGSGRSSRLLIDREGFHWRWYSILGAAAAYIVLTWNLPDYLRSYYRPFSASSVSMEPTLRIGDRFLAKMRDYGALSRGDLVIVHAHNSEFVKRIAGLPGDRIAMKEGVVFLNGSAVAQSRIGEYTVVDPRYRQPPAVEFEETFPAELEGHRALDQSSLSLDNFAEISLGEGQYFLLGDNRDSSVDSRMSEAENGLGIVRREAIIGKCLFRFWRTGLRLAEGKL